MFRGEIGRPPCNYTIARIGDWWCLATLTPFITRSHSLTPPHFFFLFLHSPNDPFWQFFFWLLSKMYPNLYFAWKIDQNLSNFHHLTPIFLVFSLNDPLFWKKKISHWKIPSFELLSENPHHFPNWVPRSNVQLQRHRGNGGIPPKIYFLASQFAPPQKK